MRDPLIALAVQGVSVPKLGRVLELGSLVRVEVTQGLPGRDRMGLVVTVEAEVPVARVVLVTRVALVAPVVLVVLLAMVVAPLAAAGPKDLARHAHLAYRVGKQVLRIALQAAHRIPTA